MKPIHRIARILVKQTVTICAMLLLTSTHAFATQQHADPEGLYSHQIAHIFFTASMVVLIVQIALAHQWIGRRNGWHYIGISAALFIAWNLDTFMVHVLDEYVTTDLYSGSGYWTRRFDVTAPWAMLNYSGKLIEHALLVGAMLSFVKALRLFSAEPPEDHDS